MKKLSCGCFTEIFTENDHKDMWQIVSNHEKSVKSGMSHKTVKPLKIQKNKFICRMAVFFMKGKLPFAKIRGNIIKCIVRLNREGFLQWLLFLE